MNDWQSSPTELLKRIQDITTNEDDLFETILYAEIAKFNEEQTTQLVKELFFFIFFYRSTQNEHTKTIVGAAIRKLALNLQDNEIEQYANLFLNSQDLSCEIELELIKAILWKLQSISPLPRCPKLESSLLLITITYLHPNFILQKNYASILLNASLALQLFDNRYFDIILERIKLLDIDWLTDLFERKLSERKK